MGLFDRFRKKQTQERLATMGKDADAGKKAKSGETGKAVQAKPADVKSAQGGSAMGGKDDKKTDVQKREVVGDHPSFAHAVLLYPLITEKATILHTRNQYSFAVHVDATKPQIRQAVRDVYGVLPDNVNVQRYDGHHVSFGRHRGRTRNWKKAIVTLKTGDSITITEAS